MSDWELVKISPDRWPAVDGTERAEVLVFPFFLRLENLSSPAPGTEPSWSPSGEGKPGTQVDQSDK